VWKFVVGGAFVAFAASGPLQHAGALPQTAVGDLSKQAIKTVLGFAASDAHAGRCKPGGGWSGGKGGKQGNNGFGNGGFDGVPGGSGNSKAPNAGQKREDRVR
jgi:hypothetical protein